MGVVADWQLPGLDCHCLPLFGHPFLSVSLSLWRARWSAEGGRHEVADTNRVPWLSSPPPEVTLQHEVSGQVPGQGLGSEGLGKPSASPVGGGVSGCFYSVGGKGGWWQETVLFQCWVSPGMWDQWKCLPWRSPA